MSEARATFQLSSVYSQKSRKGPARSYPRRDIFRDKVQDRVRFAQQKGSAA